EAASLPAAGSGCQSPDEGTVRYTELHPRNPVPTTANGRSALGPVMAGTPWMIRQVPKGRISFGYS
ncbi:MAG: hypothetical protein ABJO06_05955, partial [Roseibium sp.]|uniref:hypothetical protein n=1 Tax=Roseibium sp. TaxID=1936156 RepID=UPI003296CD80